MTRRGHDRLAEDLAPERNMEAPAERIWREYFIYSADFAQASVLAAGVANGLPTQQVFNDFAIRIDSDSDFELLKTMYVATDARVYVRYRDDASGRFLHRGSLDLRDVGGFGNSGPLIGLAAPSFVPFIWPAPYAMARNATFTVAGADFSGAPNTARISFHGNKIRPGYSPWQYKEDGSPRRFRAKLPYVYPLPPDGTNYVLGANQTIPFSAPVDIEADFLVYKIVGVRTGAAMVQLQDGAGRERNWMDRAVHIDNLIGNGLHPNVLPSPRFVQRGSAVVGFIQDISGAQNTVRLYLVGVKLYEA